jgi:hypothetical protein
MQVQEFSFEGLDLEALFAEADKIGDQYLSDEEVETRDADLKKVQRDFWLTCSEETLDAL